MICYCPGLFIGYYNNWFKFDFSFNKPFNAPYLKIKLHLFYGYLKFSIKFYPLVAAGNGMINTVTYGGAVPAAKTTMYQPIKPVVKASCIGVETSLY